MRLPRTNSQLAILQDAKNRLHVLRNTWPIGIRSIDNETNRKIMFETKYIKDLETAIGIIGPCSAK